MGPLALTRYLKDDGRALLLPACRRAAALSELRFNELRGEQVVYAIHRQARAFLPQRESCPCPTRPGGPPTEIPFPAFEIAVFENRFPAFEPLMAPPKWWSTPTTTTQAWARCLRSVPRI